MNCRFTMAAHIMSMLAHAEAEKRGPVTSETMAASIQTNAVVVRRLVAELVRAGLVMSKRGAQGGVTLARTASAITLYDVYAAVEDKTELFGRAPSKASTECPIGPDVAGFLEGVFGRAELALQRSLQQVTVAQMFHDILGRVQRRRAPRTRR